MDRSLFSAYSFSLSANNHGTIGKFPFGYYKLRIVSGNSTTQFIEIEILGGAIKSIFSKGSSGSFSIYRKVEGAFLTLATNISTPKVYLLENSDLIQSSIETINNDDTYLLITLNYGDGFYEQPIASSESENKSILRTKGLEKVNDVETYIASNGLVTTSSNNGTKIRTNYIKKGSLKTKNIFYNKEAMNVENSRNFYFVNTNKETLDDSDANLITNVSFSSDRFNL